MKKDTGYTGRIANVGSQRVEAPSAKPAPAAKGTVRYKGEDLRSGTGSNPTPTRSRTLYASAAAAEAIPLSRKQSSHSHSSSRPASSAARTTDRSRSGGSCGRNTVPSVVTW